MVSIGKATENTAPLIMELYKQLNTNTRLHVIYNRRCFVEYRLISHTIIVFRGYFVQINSLRLGFSVLW